MHALSRATQHTATHCNTLRRTAICCDTCCNTLQHTLQHAAPRCTTLHHAATHSQYTARHNSCTSLETPCIALQHTATKHTATHCNTLQHTAKHCNTLQHMPPAHSFSQSPTTSSFIQQMMGKPCRFFQPMMKLSAVSFNQG